MLTATSSWFLDWFSWFISTDGVALLLHEGLCTDTPMVQHTKLDLQCKHRAWMHRLQPTGSQHARLPVGSQCRLDESISWTHPQDPAETSCISLASSASSLASNCDFTSTSCHEPVCTRACTCACVRVRVCIAISEITRVLAVSNYSPIQLWT